MTIDLFVPAAPSGAGGEPPRAAPYSAKKVGRQTPPAAVAAGVLLADIALEGPAADTASLFEQRGMDVSALPQADAATSADARSTTLLVDPTTPDALPVNSSTTAATQPRAANQLPRAEVGDTFYAPFGALSIAPDNPWGKDVADDEPFRRIVATAAIPTDLDPLLVVRDGNGWSIVGDPAALIAVVRVYDRYEALSSLELPVRELTGSTAAVVLHTARQALGGRAFKNMRRARLSLRLLETEGLSGKAVAAYLGLHSSGTTRDLKAARMEREHPALAQILRSPSDAPVSYYTELREYADTQPQPDKVMATIVTAAARLAKAGQLFSPLDAKVALGVSKARSPTVIVEVRTALRGPGYLDGVVLERSLTGATRLIISLPADTMSDEARLAAVESWLNAANPLVGAGA